MRGLIMLCKKMLRSKCRFCGISQMQKTLQVDITTIFMILKGQVLYESIEKILSQSLHRKALQLLPFLPTVASVRCWWPVIVSSLYVFISCYINIPRSVVRTNMIDNLSKLISMYITMWNIFMYLLYFSWHGQIGQYEKVCMKYYIT